MTQESIERKLFFCKVCGGVHSKASEPVACSTMRLIIKHIVGGETGFGRAITEIELLARLEVD